MSFPLVSVSGVFESDIVSTKQPTDTGAFALCSCGHGVLHALSSR